MTLLMRDQENIEKGENRYAQLIQKLLKENRYDAIEQAGKDKVYRQKLYKEYHIL